MRQENTPKKSAAAIMAELEWPPETEKPKHEPEPFRSYENQPPVKVSDALRKNIAADQAARKL